MTIMTMDKLNRRIDTRWSEILVSGLLVFGLGPFGAAGTVRAESASARFPIGSDKIESAMRDALISTEHADVKLSVPMTSAVADVALQVDSASVVDRRTVRLRLTCRDRSQCLPFFATVSYAEDVDAKSLSASRSFADGIAKPPATRNSMLRAGAQAMLECDADKIHIRIEVICLEAGALGSRIRVSSLDHKQIYMARVVAATLLKGELLK